MAGRKRKRMTFEDEKVDTERRRSSRIILLEEKKRIEDERRMTSTLEMENNSTNYGNKFKDKGKAKINEVDGLDDFIDDAEEDDFSEDNDDDSDYNEDDEVSDFNGKRVRRAGRGGASRRRGPYMPRKGTLGRILDKLQREEDPDGFFAEPDNLNPMVENQGSVVKQPMDFATMRAKLHEDLYTNPDEMKRDVFLICSNAMATYPRNSRPYKAAKAILALAWECFDKIDAKIERVDLGISKYKKGTRKKGRRRRTLKNERVPRKYSGRKKVKTSETDQRNTYKPPTPVINPSIVAEAGIQLQERLMKFGEDLGLIAKTHQQPHDDPPASLSNRPLRIHEPSSIEGNINVNTIEGIDSAAEARAIEVLANIFLKNKDNNKGETGNINGCDQTPNAARGIAMDNIEGPSNEERMAALPLNNDNDNNNMRQLSGVNNVDEVTIWSTVIPRDKLKASPPLALISNIGSQGSLPRDTDHLEPSLLHNPRREGSIPDLNLSSAPSLLPQQVGNSVHKAPAWWDMGKGNMGTLSPVGTENVLSLSQQTPTGRCSVSRATTSHVAHVPNDPNASSVTPCQTGNLHALLGSPQQIQHQAASYRPPPPPPPQGLPQAPFHHQGAARPSSSTSTPQTPVSGALNHQGRRSVWLFGSKIG